MTEPSWDRPPPPQYSASTYGPPPYSAPPYGQPAPVDPWGRPQQEDTLLAVLSHLSPFVGLSIIGPLVVYLVKRDSPFTRGNAAGALNFHLTLLIAAVVSVPLVFVVIGIFTLLATVIVGTVFSIIAAVAASRGQVYRYPLAIPFVH